MTNKKPNISVVLPVYNNDATISESINSILNQTYKNFEIIICDDGSTDKTFSIAKYFQNEHHEKIILIKNEINLGLNATLNKCLEYCSGVYIARMDGDDISLPSRFEEMINLLEVRKDISFVSSAMIHFDENGDWGTSFPIEEPRDIDLIKGSQFSHAATIIRKKDLFAVGKYSVSKSTTRVEDFNLWINLYMNGYKGFNITKPLYKMRDDFNAYKRRKAKYRYNEFKQRLLAYKSFDAPFYYVFYVILPLFYIFIPKSIYMFFHKKKLSKR